ncbi:hypothetical protein GSI_05839 [Ganoderma sinense ZZ0214-1]|uniref:Uncharacterized protein n=1 Tax=Ganoderma sinense ZZ0214-1 TaxID=1077348 RepID=A0A2G8SBM8_9APHY|nr:hypothetical protein GSI_05839 [Ganoderma sinense ZZ0214-1]
MSADLDIDRPANGTVLCVDVRACLDAYDFAFYPNNASANNQKQSRPSLVFGDFRPGYFSQPPLEEDDAERDRRWRKLPVAYIPQPSKLPEIEHPPDTFTARDAEAPHMLR